LWELLFDKWYMTSAYERANAEERREINRRDALRWNIIQLLVANSDILVTLEGQPENCLQPIIQVLGGSMKSPDTVRPAQVGLVNIEFLDHPGNESTTISVDERRYLLDDNGARRIDVPEEKPGEDDTVQTMFDVVTPLWKGVTVTWDPLLSRMKATEQLEAHPNWDYLYDPKD
jgi:hypothetical protein